MSRVKEDLSWVSLNQLCVLTGKQSRTIKKLLAEKVPREESGKLLYKSSEVLPIIYGLGKPKDGDEKLDAWQEKARFDSLRARKVELEIDILEATLIPANVVQTSWQRVLGVLRSRILTLPSRLSPKLLGLTDAVEVERMIKLECYDALAELSQYNDGISRNPDGQDSKELPSDPGTATGSEGK